MLSPLHSDLVIIQTVDLTVTLEILLQKPLKAPGQKGTTKAVIRDNVVLRIMHHIDDLTQNKQHSLTWYMLLCYISSTNVKYFITDYSLCVA